MSELDNLHIKVTVDNAQALSGLKGLESRLGSLSSSFRAISNNNPFGNLKGYLSNTESSLRSATATMINFERSVLGGTGRLSQGFGQAFRQTSSLQGGISGLGSVLGTIVNPLTVTTAGVIALGAGLATTATHAIKAYAELEQMTYSMASLMNATLQYYDTAGKPLPLEKNFEKSLQASKKLISEFRKDAPKLVNIETGDLLKTATYTLPTLGGLGITTLEKQKQLIEGITTAIKQLGIAQTDMEFRNEAQAFLSGNVSDPRAEFAKQVARSYTSTGEFATKKGATGEGAFKQDYEQAKQLGKAFEFLNKQLEAYVTSSNLSASTLGNQLSVLRDAYGLFGSEIGEGLGNSLKAVVQSAYRVIFDAGDKMSSVMTTRLQNIGVQFGGFFSALQPLIQPFLSLLLNGLELSTQALGVISAILRPFTTIIGNILQIVSNVFGVGLTGSGAMVNALISISDVVSSTIQKVFDFGGQLAGLFPVEVLTNNADIIVGSIAGITTAFILLKTNAIATAGSFLFLNGQLALSGLKTFIANIPLAIAGMRTMIANAVAWGIAQLASAGQAVAGMLAYIATLFTAEGATIAFGAIVQGIGVSIAGSMTVATAGLNLVIAGLIAGTVALGAYIAVQKDSTSIAQGMISAYQEMSANGGRTYAELIKKAQEGDKEAQKHLATIQEQARNYDKLSSTAKEALAKIANDTDITTSEAKELWDSNVFSAFEKANIYMRGVWSLTVKGISNAWRATVSFLGDVWGKVVRFISDGMAKISSALDGLLSRLGKVGSAIKQSLGSIAKLSGDTNLKIFTEGLNATKPRQQDKGFDIGEATAKGSAGETKKKKGGAKDKTADETDKIKGDIKDIELKTAELLKQNKLKNEELLLDANLRKSIKEQVTDKKKENEDKKLELEQLNQILENKKQAGTINDRTYNALKNQYAIQALINEKDNQLLDNTEKKLKLETELERLKKEKEKEILSDTSSLEKTKNESLELIKQLQSKKQTKSILAEIKALQDKILAVEKQRGAIVDGINQKYDENIKKTKDELDETVNAGQRIKDIFKNKSDFLINNPLKSVKTEGEKVIEYLREASLGVGQALTGSFKKAFENGKFESSSFLKNFALESLNVFNNIINQLINSQIKKLVESFTQASSQNAQGGTGGGGFLSGLFNRKKAPTLDPTRFGGIGEVNGEQTVFDKMTEKFIPLSEAMTVMTATTTTGTQALSLMSGNVNNTSGLFSRIFTGLGGIFSQFTGLIKNIFNGIGGMISKLFSGGGSAGGGGGFLSTILGAFGGSGGGGGKAAVAGSIISKIFGGFRANGGAVGAGSAYMVGERGHELFIPQTDGYIVNNNDLRNSRGSSGGAVVHNHNYNISALDSKSFEAFLNNPQNAKVMSGRIVSTVNTTANKSLSQSPFSR